MKRLLLTIVTFGLMFSMNTAYAKKTKAVKLNESEKMFWAKQEKRIQSVTSAERKAMPFLTLSEYGKLSLLEQVRYVKLLRHSLHLANQLQSQFYKKNKKRAISSLWWLTGHQAEAHRRHDGADHTHDYKKIAPPGMLSQDRVMDSTINGVVPTIYKESIREPFQAAKGNYQIIYGELCLLKSSGKPGDNCSFDHSRKGSACRNHGGRSCGYLTGLSSYHGNKNACINKVSSKGNGTDRCVAKAYELASKQKEHADAVYKHLIEQIKIFQSSGIKASRGSQDCDTRFPHGHQFEKWQACTNGHNIVSEPKIEGLKKLLSSLKYEQIKGLAISGDGDNIKYLRDDNLTLEDLRVDPRIDATLLYISSASNEITGGDLLKHKALVNELFPTSIDKNGNAILSKDSALITALNRGYAYKDVKSSFDEYNNHAAALDGLFEGVMQHCSRGIAQELQTFDNVDRKENPRVRDLAFQQRDCEALIGNGCIQAANSNKPARLCSVTDALVNLNKELTEGHDDRHETQGPSRQPKRLYNGTTGVK